MAKEGIEERHRGGEKPCPASTKPPGKCNCKRSYRASVYNTTNKKHEYSGWKKDKAAVEKWRTQAIRELETGSAPVGQTPILSDAWDDWYASAKSGAIASKDGGRYKDRTLETYERAWRVHIEDEFGSKRIGAITRKDLQAWVDKKAKAGMPKSTLNNALEPLRVLCRYAFRRSVIVANPTADLEMPAAAKADKRFATKDEAKTLIAALPSDQQALWATAFYAGARRGELQALRWSNVDLGTPAAFTILKAWSAGETATKTKAGVRRVPIVPPLKALLEAHKKATGRSGDDLVFGRTAADPFVPSTVRSQALKAWKDLPLEPITLHDCRHTAASFMIASGANAKALSVVMGHSTIEITFDLYGHLMPGGEDEVGGHLATYLAAA